MHSIRTKITALTMAAILVSVAAVGWISIACVRNAGEKYSSEVMRLICDNSRSSIDDYLNSIEKSVNMVSRFATDELDPIELVEAGVVGADGWKEPDAPVKSVKRQERLDQYLSEYMEKVEALFRSVANHTNGAISFYYRINPELSEAQTGFLYSSVKSTAFVKILPTRLDIYGEDDMEHVSWYYTPLKKGRPIWINNYYNKNLDTKMVSYVTPLYKAGTFIGVIGMDIDYETLIDQIRDITIYETGFAFLLSEDGTIGYHPVLQEGVKLAEHDPRMTYSVELMGREESNTEPLRYDLDGQQRQMFFSTLKNGMKLAVTAPVSEVNAIWQQLTKSILIAGSALLIVFLLLAVVLVHRMTEPLRRLTAASRSIEAGNYNVQLDYTGHDEIGLLTGTFQHLVNHLQVYIGDLNSKAYQDGLTGTRNKAAYNMSQHKLNDEIRAAGSVEQPEFAIVMLDCNDLKYINDTFGHEKGDVYLRSACSLICDTFIHSPVFRVGGDEFIVLLRGEAFLRRDNLLREFYDHAAKINAGADNPWERINVAMGLAVYNPERDKTAEDVLQRADKLMYDNKRKIKELQRRSRTAGSGLLQ